MWIEMTTASTALEEGAQNERNMRFHGFLRNVVRCRRDRSTGCGRERYGMNVRINTVDFAPRRQPGQIGRVRECLDGGDARRRDKRAIIVYHDLAMTIIDYYPVIFRAPIEGST